jgi:hypothetical protein
MKKILLVGACALALSATGALAQTNQQSQGGEPSAKSTTMSPSSGHHMKKEHKTTGSAMHKSGAAKSPTSGQGTNAGGSRY